MNISFQFVPILFVISTSSMLIMDQRTMQIKYRIPASEILRLSLSPYFDDIAVFHVRAVSNIFRCHAFDTRFNFVLVSGQSDKGAT